MSKPTGSWGDEVAKRLDSMVALYLGVAVEPERPEPPST